MARALDWAAERGIPRVQLNVREANGIAIGLYEKLGFATVSRVMSRAASG